MEHKVQKGAGPVLGRLRQATGAAHRSLEDRFDAVAELSDGSRRPAIISRYAALYHSALAALARELEGIDGLDFARRRQAWSSVGMNAPAKPTPSFPEPADRSEALGALYVVEGSTLGGRIILRQLQARGITDAELSFLDPYGRSAGVMWRSLLAVLEREGARTPASLESMCRGARRGFSHAEQILCGELL